MTWTETPQDEWNDAELEDAITWVQDTLALRPSDRSTIAGLLETYGPEDITPERMEAAREAERYGA